MFDLLLTLPHCTMWLHKLMPHLLLKKLEQCIFLVVLIQFQWVITYYCLYTLFMLCFLLSVFPFYVFFFPRCENKLNERCGPKTVSLTLLLLVIFFFTNTYYCLYTLFMLCFLLSVFCFFFPPLREQNLANVVDQKQSFLDATTIGNFSLHKHQLVLLTLALVGLTLSNLHHFNG